MTTQISPLRSEADRTSALTLSVFRQLLSDFHPRDFAVRLWDGAEWPAETDAPRFTLVLRHPDAVRRLFEGASNELTLGEAYLYDDFDVEGDFEAVFTLAEFLARHPPGVAALARLGWTLARLGRRTRRAARRPADALRGRPHSVERDRQAVTAHYDVSNDFYALWLDRRMVYSCAYFESPDDSLDAAQERKLDYLCRKLRLRPGERLLDIGCGWGGLILHAAEHYGVEATGITLSRAQAGWAERRIAEAGLQDRCRAVVCDYRRLDGTPPFDKLLSVGMFEHVGRAMLPAYFEQAWRLLKPGGVFLNHGIATHASDGPPTPREKSFTHQYVFPDGELLPLPVTLRCAEEARFEVRDVENLREHYALTLRHWVRRLEAAREPARRIVNEPTYRSWRLFMASAAHRFAVGRLHLFQLLLARPDRGAGRLPLTRRDWYDAPLRSQG